MPGNGDPENRAKSGNFDLANAGNGTEPTRPGYCDIRSYQEGLFARLTDIPTLVTGPTGTGKELVAEAIGFSRYLPFDPDKRRFSALYNEDFHPLNLSALSPLLIESELFGHQRGAFTGAWHEKQGWLELVGQHGTVFLDEIGELDASLQVKLLRAIEKRTFQRLGETKVRRLLGRIVAATHRDLAEAMESGAFRADLYYRLCGLSVELPPLRARPLDILPLAQLFLDEAERLESKHNVGVPFAPAPKNARGIDPAASRRQGEFMAGIWSGRREDRK